VEAEAGDEMSDEAKSAKPTRRATDEALKSIRIIERAMQNLTTKQRLIVLEFVKARVESDG
jgi:hypothetical protein